MPHPLRIAVPGYLHHVTQRGIRSTDAWWSEAFVSTVGKLTAGT